MSRAGREDLDRLERALIRVQGELDRTLSDSPRLRILVTDLERNWYHFTAYVADAEGGYYHAGDSGLFGENDDYALTSVADGVQDFLADVECVLWPVCPVHDRGLHVWPPGVEAMWVDQGNGTWPPGHPIWWCKAGHEVARIGELP